MEQLGRELKRAREAAGISLSEMATRTKIAVTALEALERDDYSRLPGGIFGRSFVRSYAVEVGADPDAIVSRFIEQLEASEAEAAARRAAMMPAITSDDRQFLERQRRALMLLRVGLLIAAVAIVALVTWRVRVFLASRQAAAAPAAAVTPAPVVPPPPADFIPAPMTATPAPAQPSAPVEAGPMIVELDVSADCWISLAVDGGPDAARLFRAGDHQRLEVNREVLLDVGNAGGVRLIIDGRPARALGATGARVRTRITRQNASEFLETSATPQAGDTGQTPAASVPAGA